jgi:3-hydroxypropanoate dehydrogenase
MTDTMTPVLTGLDEPARQLLFSEARTVNNFSSQPVSDAELEAIWELAKWPPTAANTQPLRVVYVRTPEGKERLLRHMNEGNVAKTRSAPVTAILAADHRFHEHIPRVLPYRPEMRDVLEAQEQKRRAMAEFNSTLQAGYFILAVRANGLHAGPMGGFDADGLDAEFFPDGRWHAILTVNIGHPGEGAWFDRLPRLELEDVVQWA